MLRCTSPLVVLKCMCPLCGVQEHTFSYVEVHVPSCGVEVHVPSVVFKSTRSLMLKCMCPLVVLRCTCPLCIVFKSARSLVLRCTSPLVVLKCMCPLCGVQEHTFSYVEVHVPSCCVEVHVPSLYCVQEHMLFFCREILLCLTGCKNPATNSLLFWYPFHPCVSAVAHKGPLSFCQKCRWQVTAKHACILCTWLCMK